MAREKQELAELPVLEGYVTISKAAEALQISRAAAHLMARKGRLRAWRVPSAGPSDPVLVSAAQVEELRGSRAAVVAVV